MNLIYIYIYESFTFWNKLQENAVFHDIKMFGDAPVYLFIFTVLLLITNDMLKIVLSNVIKMTNFRYMRYILGEYVVKLLKY